MKKLFTMLIAAFLTVSAGALSLDTAENSSQNTADTSYSTLSNFNSGKPGYNLWTGNEFPYDFDNNPVIGDNNQSEINKDWSTVVLETTEANNVAIKLSGDNPRFTVTTAFPEFASDERPFTLKFDSKTTTTADMSFRVRPNRPGKWQYVNDVAKDCRAGILYVNLKNFNSGEWVSHTYTLDASNFTDHDAPLTDYSKVQSFWLGLAGGFSNTYVLIDNVSIIPNYKITYDLGEGAGSFEDEFFYGDTYKLKVDTSLITPPEGKVFSHWEHQYGDTLTDSVYPILGEDLYLTAVYVDKAEEEPSKAGAPGYNLWTGTIDPFTFEGNPTIGFNASNKINIDWSGVALDSTTEAGNTSIKMTGDNPRFSVTDVFPTFESTERTFTLIFDAKTNYTGNMHFKIRPNRPGKWQYVNDVAKRCLEGIVTINITNTSTGDWVHHEVYVDPAGFTDNDSPLTDFTKITSFWLGLDGGYGDNALWIDNVKIVPNYKVTYDLGEGIGSFEDEFFYGDTYKLKVDTSLITPPEGKVFSHWENQHGDEIADSVCPILGEDLYLTAVYVDEAEDEPSYIGAPGYNLWTGTIDPFTFEGNPTIGSNASNKINIDWSGVALDSTTEAGNTSIKMTGDNPRFSVTDVFPTFESTERTFTLIFDAKTNYTGNMYFKIRPNRPGKWQYVNDVAKRCLEGIVTINITETSNGDWVHHEVLVDPAGFTDNDAPLTDFTKITSFWLGLDGGYGDNALWIDNVKIVPNYKVTYDLGEGSGTLANEFFYSDSYKLKADMSTVTAPAGKVFSHWVDDSGNVVTDTVVPVLGQDVNLTAAWKDDAPNSYDKYEIRLNTNPGIRYFASVTASQKERSEEYGYIVARNVVLTETIGLEAEDLTFELTATNVSNPMGTIYLKGVAYENKDGGDPETDIVYDADDNGNIIFTAVCTGIDLDDASQLTEQLVVRPYITVNGVTCYGTPRVKSFYEVASEISTSEAYDTLPQAQKDMIAHILEVCGN